MEEHGNRSDDDGVENDSDDDFWPALLLGTGGPMTKEEALVNMPPLPITDRLVSRFLKTSELSLVVLSSL